MEKARDMAFAGFCKIFAFYGIHARTRHLIGYDIS